MVDTKIGSYFRKMGFRTWDEVESWGGRLRAEARWKHLLHMDAATFLLRRRTLAGRPVPRPKKQIN